MLILQLTNAVMNQDCQMMQQTVQIISQSSKDVKEKEDWDLLSQAAHIEVENFDVWKGTLRKLLTRAVQIGIRTFDQVSIHSMLSFSQSHMLTLVV